tara:strand:- start:1371 stop:2000 length:630 start_codon:yes stop_codon:yes gene_type:complete
MDPMIQDLIDMDDDDFRTQGLELADQAYEWEEGTAEKALADDASSLLRAALGDDINSISKANKRRLERTIGKKVLYYEDALYLFKPSEPLTPDNVLISDGDLSDIVVQITSGDPDDYYTGLWNDDLEKGWQRVKQIILQLVEQLVISDWELNDWMEKGDYSIRREKIINPKNAFLEMKYDLIIHDPYYARLFQKDKIKVSRIRNVEYDL